MIYKKLIFPPLFTGMLFLLFSCGGSRVPVAVMTKLEAGSIVGSSEVNMAKLYMDEKKNSGMDVQSVNDNWDPAQSKEALAEISKKGIKLLVTSHTSTCAVEIMDRINSEKIITIVTGATTDKLTRKDDYIFRNIPDVEKEQKEIAGYINGLPGTGIVIIRDLGNIGYTGPALNFFKKYCTATVSGVIDINADTLDPPGLKAAMAGRGCGCVYILVGGYKSNAAGAIAQIAKSMYPACKIIFTPWVRSPLLLESAGSAIKSCVLPSHYPPRGKNAALDGQIELFKKKFGYAPTYISFNVYCALQILDEAITAGKTNPDDIKRYILEKKTFRTKFIDVTFDEYGDSGNPLYFVTDIEKEF